MTTPAPVPVAASPTAKSKDPKKVAAGRAGAAARKAKQESLLEELRAAKQSLQTEAVAEAVTPVADVVPKEQPVAKQQPMPAPGDPGDPVKADWTPWILLVGAGLAALCVWRSPLVKLTERQQKQQHPEARSSGATLARQPPATPRCAQHLKVPDDPHLYGLMRDHVFYPDPEKYRQRSIPCRRCWWPGNRVCKARPDGL